MLYFMSIYIILCLIVLEKKFNKRIISIIFGQKAKNKKKKQSGWVFWWKKKKPETTSEKVKGFLVGGIDKMKKDI